MITKADVDRWLADGSFKRIHAAIEQRTPVNIKRSSGEMVTGYAAANGHGGCSVVVVWGDGAEQWRYDGSTIRVGPGVKSKLVHTDEFLAWNPEIGAPS